MPHPIRYLILLVLTFSGFTTLLAQNLSISGTITDNKSGEQLIGALITVKELPGTGVAANSYGYYSLQLKPGSYTIVYSYLGYSARNESVTLSDKNLSKNIALEQVGRNIKEVEISGDRPDENLTRVQMGVEKLTPREIKQIPVLFGEQDVLKTLQLLPGVKGAGEGNAGFYVRGGAADQNLILLDEAPVYNASHLLGFFSVFNSDAIKDVTLYKGSMPAEFGGRIASVLDVKMNDGNQKRFNALGGIGLISSRLTLEAPLKKDRSSLIVSGRRTYADMFLKLSNNEDLKNSTLYFYDLNAKFNYKINDKNRVFLSGYFGRDNFGFSDVFKFSWGNSTATARWNHLFSDKLFSNTSAIYSNYDYQISITASEDEVNISSTIRDINLKQDYQYFLNNRHTVKFGWNSIYHTFLPGKINGTGSLENVISNENRYAWENAIYGSDEWKVNGQLSLSYGLRLSEFSYLGPGTIYTYTAEGEVATERVAKSGELVKNYLNPEPRFSANYHVDDRQSVKAGYARTVQNLHLLSNTTSGNPTDVWVPSSNNIQPELCDQYSLGYFRNLKSNMYEFSAETYYKWMQNQIDYRNGAELTFNQKVEGELVYGVGRAYGLELLLRKKTGKFTGWIGYTLSRTERKFEEINEGKYFAARQDRTHDISIVGMYSINTKLSVSANWVYYTGNAVTFPSGKYQVDGQTVNYYTERNGYRMPAYHRLDLGLTWYRKSTPTYESNWNFSVYNAYARRNAYTISFRDSETNPGTTEAVKLSLFRIVPSITYNFHFK